MKTKEVIRQLQEADPSGEEEVCVDNIDIFYIDKMPAYYDGTLQVLKRDENARGYNIRGAEYRRTGNKINIHTMDIHSAIWDDDGDLPVTYTGFVPGNDHIKEGVEKARKEVKDFMKKLEIERNRK